MRRACLIAVVSCLILPGAALAGDRSGVAQQADGSLAVTAASGTIIVQGGGLIYGHLTQGTLWIVQYKPDDPTAVFSVTGAKAHLSGGYVVYSGSDIRFLLPAGRYVIELNATGVDISAVGHGIVGLTGLGTIDDGTFAVNGAKPVQITKVSASQAFGGKAL
jgi:hypothetical protein